MAFSMHPCAITKYLFSFMFTRNSMAKRARACSCASLSPVPETILVYGVECFGGGYLRIPSDLSIPHKAPASSSRSNLFSTIGAWYRFDASKAVSLARFSGLVTIMSYVRLLSDAHMLKRRESVYALHLSFRSHIYFHISEDHLLQFYHAVKMWNV